MKKIFMLLSLFLFLFTPIVAAQTEESEIIDVEMVSTQSAMAVTNLGEDYTLPYPGILPDNPLYILKTTRDNLVGMLISNPLKKAEFNLLQADKRLQAGFMLIQKDKKHYDIAETTISKGENYFSEAIVKTTEAKKMNMETSDIESRLEKAIYKHKIVIAEIEKTAPKEHKEGFASLRKRVDGMILTLSAIASQKKK